jgi:hypothetical protein
MAFQPLGFQPPSKPRLLERVTGLGRFLPSFPPSTRGPETESIRARARRDTSRIKRTWLARGILVVIELAALVTVEEVLVSASKASVRVAVLIVLVAAVPFVVIGWVYVFQAARAPFRQRKEWRVQLPREREEARARSEAERESAEERIAAERKAFEEKWQETEHLRGLLGEAENTIHELRSRGATLESETPNIVSRLITSWEDKSFDHPDHCKFGANIEVTNRERDRASVRFALIFHSQTMHSESEQDEPPIRIDGRETKRVTVSFYFPKMFVDPFRTEGGGPPHASSMRLALRELISDTERVSDVRP